MTPETRRSRALFEPAGPSPASSDGQLVRACLGGKEQAWAALIEKYKDLIYSIPIKYRAPSQDAADIFQGVCLQLFSELPKLRKAESLRSWLITICIRKCYQWKQKQRRWSGEEPEEVELRAATGAGGSIAPPSEHVVIEEAQREQIVREALDRLPDRCREMIRLLFFEDPPLPYAEVALRLGLATGSIGFIRGRCLKRLEKVLKEMGFA